MSWRPLASCAVLFLLIVPVSARADDELSQFVQRSKLAAQKLTTDVNHALAQAKVLEKGDLEQARTLLERVLGQVKDSQDLPAADRTRLTQQLQVRLRDLSETARRRRIAEEEAAQRPDPNRPRPAPAGNAGPAAVAQGFIGNGNSQLDATKKQRLERDNGFNGVIRSVDNSAVPIAGDVAFAKNWKQLSEIRKATVGPQMTAKEVALVKTLNSTMSVDFRGDSFKDVLSYLQEKTGLAIIVDEGSLREAMVDYEADKVTFQAKKLTVRTVLRKLLADRDLAYILKEGTVQVVTNQKARETMVVRTYPINDLVAPGPYAQMFGPFVAQVQMLNNAQGVINLIQNSIDPPMWNVNGGPASVTFTPQGMALVIRASAEMHYSLGGQLLGQ